ncbi:type IV pilus-like protein [Pseudomonas saudimassiliensis]|uniref:Type II secretion system protein H n=1 Tax=Pseudomonas saudimassiliensis TaxID=1461581 RepID=A0A078M5V9_9PSED|nr:GspH/FimT family pseudopilin [Pseudomonas saudimassiliensis]CEA02833.1 type IV pilus-like protein [Pseudomonas saudimassiliensis]CEF25965.1 type IV pilus-like protein [Pseudomonas saudimassiliensis]
MTRVKGFTLIELMVTIAVAAILISIAIPSFRNMIIDYRLTTIASDLADAVSFARSEAIKRNRTITFCQTNSASSSRCGGSGGWQHWLVVQNAASADADDVIRRGTVSTHNSTVQVTSDLNNNRLTFSTDGLGRSGSALINDAKITICATSGPAESIREITLGAASRTSIRKVSGGCS